MNLLNYSLTAAISYIGLFVGFILAMIAEEEIKPGKKYLIYLQKIILLLIFIFLVTYINLNYTLAILILAFIIIHIIKKSYKKEFNEIPYTYIILAIIFYLSSKNPNLFVIESSLIFLYGLPAGSLLTKKSKKESIANILINIPFVLIAIILFLIF